MSRLGIMGGVIISPLMSSEKALRGRDHKIANMDDLCHCALCAISSKKNSRAGRIAGGGMSFATGCFWGSGMVIVRKIN
eukprot:scaffold229571_cov46-Attheya_sp.AAC.3